MALQPLWTLPFFSFVPHCAIRIIFFKRLRTWTIYVWLWTDQWRTITDHGTFSCSLVWNSLHFPSPWPLTIIACDDIMSCICKICDIAGFRGMIFCECRASEMLIPHLDSIVGIATGYGLETEGSSSSPGRVKNFLLSTSSRPALRPTQPPIQ
jgi:hypothetical protein